MTGPAAMASPPHVRDALPGDAEAMGALQVRAWRFGYAGHLPTQVLAGLTPEGVAAGWRAAIVAPPSDRHRVLVAVADAQVAGFAALGPAPDADLAGPDRTDELVILAVDPGLQRRGHGSRLLNAAMDHARGEGAVLAVTWVVVADEPLRGLLQSSGWAPDGAWRDLDVGEGATVRQVRLHTRLAEL